MVNAPWLCSMQSEIFLQIKFIIFQGCTTKLLFLFGRPAPYNQLLIQQLDYEITLNILEFIISFIEQIKPGFSLSSMCRFPELNGIKSLSYSFHLQNSGILKTRIDPRVTSWKWILTIFKCKSEVPKQLRLKKQMIKMGSLVLFSYLLPDLWPLNCQTLCPCCNFLLISTKNLRL